MTAPELTSFRSSGKTSFRSGGKASSHQFPRCARSRRPHFAPIGWQSPITSVPSLRSLTHDTVRVATDHMICGTMGTDMIGFLVLLFPFVLLGFVLFMEPVSYTHLTLPTKRIV